MTPYRALSMAVRNEERAFAFWSYVAGFAEDPEIKKSAESMAREELGHVATLRKERRRAYHSEHGATRAGQGGNVADGQVDAGGLERRLVAHLADLEGRVAGASFDRVRELRQEATGMSAEADGIDDFPAALNGPMPKPSQRLWPMPISMAPRVPMIPIVLKPCKRSPSARSPALLGCGHWREQFAD